MTPEMRYAQSLIFMHCSGFDVSKLVRDWAFDSWVDQETRARRQRYVAGLF